ncbi:MAG: acyl-CoA dehydrogenase family protein [Bdellovibrionales bacterium]
MKSFEAPDLFELDQLFTREQRMIRDSLREFVNSEVLPIIEECHIEGRFPSELVPKLADLGVLGPQLTGYDCAGLDQTSYGIIMREIERGDSGIRSFCSVTSSLCMYPIHRYGTEELKKKFLPDLAKGRKIGAFGLTESDFGSNPAGMRTRAVKKGDKFILNGGKMWITNGSICDLAVVWARSEDDKFIGLVVEKDSPGFKTQSIQKKFSLRATDTSELIFEDCEVPSSNLLQVEGLRGPFSCLNSARYGIGWGSMGAAMACFGEARNYALTRIQFDKPIASFQLVQAKLVEMYTEITKGQMLAFHLGQLNDNDKMKPQQVSMVKMNNVSKALQIARTTRDILGANGVTHEYQCGRHMANLESVNTYEGTEDIHRLILGQHITGIPAFQ